jgi:hypothetical protein
MSQTCANAGRCCDCPYQSVDTWIMKCVISAIAFTRMPTDFARLLCQSAIAAIVKIASGTLSTLMYCTHRICAKCHRENRSGDTCVSPKMQAVSTPIEITTPVPKPVTLIAIERNVSCFSQLDRLSTQAAISRGMEYLKIAAARPPHGCPICLDEIISRIMA